MCAVFVINLSKTNIKLGKIVTVEITPNATPFAITKPISFPSVKLIVHNAKNPAIVVSELPTTDFKVSAIASAIALSLLLSVSF